MKRSSLFFALTVAGVIVFGSWILYPSGSPGGKTGSPGDGGATCTQCHTGTANPASGWITSDIPSGGYIPGETYTITATGTHTGVVRFGFETTAENGAGAKKGTFIITDAVQTKLVNGNKAVTHTTNGTTPFGNTKTWSFDWTAPAAGTGDITFYAAFNAANGNGATTGDVIYTSSLGVMEGSMPQNGLTVALSGMAPHVGQLFGARLINKYDLKETERVVLPSIPSAAFDITFENAVEGESYFIDMFADMNGNGYYDPPSADHAWRIDADNVTAGSTVSFSHNTSFTDIHWRYTLNLDLAGMTPHVGQHFEARLLDINRNMKETGRVIVDAIPGAAFTLVLPFLEMGHSYYVEFFADLNGNGRFDPLPTDHAWRLEAMAIDGDESLSFTHNANFADLAWMDLMTVEFTGMTPHVGQDLSLRVVDAVSGMETGRFYRTVDQDAMAVMVPGLVMGGSYHVDFFSDMNGNGMYDAPPADHAWRLETSSTSGNTTLAFSHNTNFTDIDWKYLVTVHAMDMDPHVGQLFELRVYEESTSEEIGLVTIDNLMVPHFFIEIPGSSYNVSYNIDFYADLNGSGGYDPPPTDHAWRVQLQPAMTDTVVEFMHNANFTNINWPVSVNENLASRIGLQVFPNPATDHISVAWQDRAYRPVEYRIYAIDGALMDNIRAVAVSKIPTGHLPGGLYYLVAVFETGERAVKPFLVR